MSDPSLCSHQGRGYSLSASPSGFNAVKQLLLLENHDICSSQQLLWIFSTSEMVSIAVSTWHQKQTHPTLETGLAIQASAGSMQMKDASIKHTFSLAVLLQVAVYLAACSLVDCCAKRAALHLFLCEPQPLSQRLSPLRGRPGR